MTAQTHPRVMLETPSGSYPLRYTIEQVPEQSDAQVAATIVRMRQYVLEDCQSDIIRADAQAALSASPSNPFEAIHSFVRSRMVFKNDDALTEQFNWLLPKPGVDPTSDYYVEMLKRPVDVSMEYALTGERVEGDCDDFSMYCAALLRCTGGDCSFATVGANPKDPTVFSHVYTVGGWGGQRVAMDCSHGPYAGWETPNRFGKYCEWDVSNVPGWGGLAIAVVAAGLLLWTNRNEVKRWIA